MPTFIIEMQQELKIQESLLNKVFDEIKNLPKGSLYCSRRGTHNYYFHSVVIDGVRQKKYVSPKNIEQAKLISNLKRKRFLLGCKKVLKENVVALRVCLQKYEELDPAQISSRLASTYENIGNTATPQNDLDWQHAPYTRAEMYEKNLKHEAIGGLWVRSKSEALISFALDLAHVPFHYEELLEVEDKKIAPDFTILHPNTGEKVYWEHFGMMDDSAYATETFRKLIIYGRNGIIPGKNLIYTIETTAEPLSILVVQRMIRQFFLE